MSQKTFKPISILIAIVLLFAPLQSAFADLIDDGTPYKLIVENHVVKDDTVDPPITETIAGAVYNVKRIAIINEDGSETPADVNLGDFTIEDGIDNGFQTATKGRYLITPVKRAPGYLLGEPFTIEFPRMKDGVIDTNQTVTVKPKIIKLLGSVELLKFESEDGSAGPVENPLAGVKFDLYQLTAVPADPSLDPTVPIQTGLTTGADGKILVEGLGEGTYKFCKTTPPAGYGPGGRCLEFSITAPDDATENPARVELKMENFLLPTIEKLVDNATPVIGEEYNYTITVPIPRNIADYTEYKIVDAFPTAVDYVSHSISPDTITYTGVYDSDTHTLTIDFDLPNLVAKFNAGVRNITVTITAKLNHLAEPGTTIKNIAKLIWKIGEEPGEDDDDADVTPKAGSVTINKKDSAGNPLPGVVFGLFTDEAATIPYLDPLTNEPVTATTDADGVAKFLNLPVGTYWLREIQVPEDYRISEVITFILIKPGEELALEYEFTNYKIDESLPVTGTLGALAFLGAGVILIGAGIFFARRKKNDQV